MVVVSASDKYYAGHITVSCSLLASDVDVSWTKPPKDGFWPWILDEGIRVSPNGVPIFFLKLYYFLTHFYLKNRRWRKVQLFCIIYL